jgi:hypothetical protein
MSYEPPTSHNPLFGQPGFNIQDDFVKAHGILREVVPEKHWSSLTTKFMLLGNKSPVEVYMRGGDSTLETIKHLLPAQNIGA